MTVRLVLYFVSLLQNVSEIFIVTPRTICEIEGAFFAGESIFWTLMDQVFTFVLRKSGAQWTVKQHSGDIEDSASSTYDLQRKLVNAARAADSSGAVQSSFSFVSPSSAVFQVVVGGAVFVGGGAVTAAPAGGAAAESAAAPAAEKKEEKVEKEEDEDFGMSLFD
ncbi:uncharacterized protein [Arachis hypogaea]|uniref:uncharacterized protein isoform X1 n=2 Tax=Arachis hypogaea TaxID=3818 RepID=UPI0034E79917